MIAYIWSNLQNRNASSGQHKSNETKRFSDLRMHMSACKQIAVLNETFECIASAAAAYQTIWMDSRDNSQQHDSL